MEYSLLISESLNYITLMGSKRLRGILVGQQYTSGQEHITLMGQYEASGQDYITMMGQHETSGQEYITDGTA